MKKIIIVTIIIISLIIGTTAVLIKIKNDKLSTTNINNNYPEEIVKEKTLDLYGTFNQNDILIMDKTINHDMLEEGVTIKQISGLKNKEVENKINKDIEEKTLKSINEFFIDDNTSYRSAYMQESANFSNVISFSLHLSYSKSNVEYINNRIGFNYNLIDGEEIKFKDLFTKNADIQTIIRDSLYKRMAKSDAYWDDEKQKWMVNEWRYDESTGDCFEETVEYVPALTDNDINKIINLFTSGTEVEFYFTPTLVHITKPEECIAKFEDFADMVVIYDKYLTNESLYERDDIGLKNILTCSREPITNDLYLYKKTSFETENLFYDISIKKSYYDKKSETAKIFSAKLNEIIQNVNLKVEEYKKIAKDNPDKIYFLFLKPTVSIGAGDFEEKETWDNLASIDYYEKIISGDISKKDELLYKVLGTYRYQNIGMYMDVYSGLNLIEYDGYHIEEPIEENVEFYTFDIITDEKINDISQIFKEGLDYKEIIENALRDDYQFKYYFDDDYNRIEIPEEELDKIFENAEYKLSATTIYVIIDGKFDSYKSVSLMDEQIWPYLNLKELEI